MFRPRDSRPAKGQRLQWLPQGPGRCPPVCSPPSLLLSSLSALPPAALWSSTENFLEMLTKIHLCPGRREITHSGPRMVWQRGEWGAMFCSYPPCRPSSWAVPGTPSLLESGREVGGGREAPLFSGGRLVTKKQHFTLLQECPPRAGQGPSTQRTGFSSGTCPSG